MFSLDVLLSSITEINRLKSKECQIFYLQVTIEKDWHSQIFDFVSLKIRLQVSFWGAPTHPDNIEF